MPARMRLFASTLLLALASAPSSDCGFGSSAAPPPPPAPDIPYCYTDPPVGCGAFCDADYQVSFSEACGNIEGGELTIQFEDLIQNLEAMATMEGKDVCTDANIGATISPCKVGIVPVERANQDHESCVTGPKCLVTVP